MRVMPSASATRHACCPASAAEHAQRVLRYVVAALDRNALDRFRHVANGDVEVAIGQLLRCQCAACGVFDFHRQRGEFLAYDVVIQPFVGATPEYPGEKCGLNFSDHHVAIGHRQRSAAPIASWARIRACRVGSDSKPRAIEMQDRSAARRHRMDAHHGRPHPHARDLRLERALAVADISAGKMRDIGRRAAHIKADHTVESRR